MSPLALPTQSITASSRVPAGSIFQCQGLVPRTVDALRAVGLEAFVASPSPRQPMASGAVAPTRHFETVRMQYGEGTTRRLYLFRQRA